MNFLRNSFSISDPPALPHDADREARTAPDVCAILSSSAKAFDSDGDDVRTAGDHLRTKSNRVAIEDHMDVPADEGGILVPCRELPENWFLSEDMESLIALDRCFVFPGERLSIVAYVTSHDASMPEIITPFRVAAMMDKAGALQHVGDKASCEGSSHVNLEGRTMVQQNQNLPVEASEPGPPSVRVALPVSESRLRMDAQEKRKAALLHSFQHSHFFARITGSDEQVLKTKTAFDQSSEGLDEGIGSVNPLEHKKSIQSGGPVPVSIEEGNFDSKLAGGVARNAICCSFGNYTAVMLQVTVATDLKKNVVLEVLQFEQPGQADRCSVERDTENLARSYESYSDSSQKLLQWLVPLDCPASPPPVAAINTTPASFINSSPQRFSGSSGSTLFSFANLRSSSIGSSQSLQSSVSSTPPHLSSSSGPDEWDRLPGQKISKGQSVGSEGLLSFRGAQLEPQRFSVHCGLEGLYVPGRRWRRKLEIVEPLVIQSYFANCNTRDLICVLIENVVPDHLPGVVITVDSISIVCQSAGPSGTPLPVPIACVEVGENHRLPGLSLRSGEQHSFILKPSNSSFHASAVDKGKDASTSTLNGHELQTTKGSNYVSGSSKTKAKEHKLNAFHESRSYALVVSCRCSHTESRLRFKHAIQWQPRPPRDLLLSVSLERSIAPEMPNGSLPPLVPQVLTVQATNLTSESLHLTLLAPSSRNANSALPVPFSTTLPVPQMSNFTSFHERKEWPVAKNEDNSFERDNIKTEAASVRPGSLQRSLSLPPVRPIESIMGISPMVVKERAISAADIAAENSSTRTHLWLQSTVPLGSVPPQSTTAVRCELLPLTDGIITLDTLHISTKARDVVYFPEQPLQIYATSSIGSGLS